MKIYLRFTSVLALAGALALGGTSAARAQDTSQVSADTSGYQGYEGGDTTLKAMPGVQTGPAASDSGNAGTPSGTAADTLVCKDGSNAARTDGCVRNGGIDWAATEAAVKARDERTRDTTQPK